MLNFHSVRFTLLVAALAASPLTTSAAQEVGAFVGGGVGGIRDVRRPFGGGVTGTLLFHDWIGVRGDAAYFWTLEHRQGLSCVPLVNEGGSRCSMNPLGSHSHFPLVDALAVVRAHIPG